MVETSIIVRTYNEERHLPNLLSMLAQQNYRDAEIVVVDSGSLDRTREIALEAGCRLIRISSHDFTFGFSLNQGIRAAEGRLLAIVSAHTAPCDEHWLDRLVEPLRSDKIAMSYGRQLGVASSKFSENEDFRRTFGPTRLTLTPPKFFANNANSAIRRDLWEQYAFDESLPGLEDIDWAKHWMDRGFQVVYEPAAAIYHIHEESWRQVRRRYYREAVAARRIGILEPKHRWGASILEGFRTLADAKYAFQTNWNPTANRLGLPQRLAEIFLFRANKAYATFKALTENHGLETEKERQELMFDRSNRAVVIHGPKRAMLEDIDIPELRPGDALVRVENVGVCATDLEIFHGTLGYFANGLATYPIVPGHEFSGRIAAMGQNVQQLQENDPVVVECIQSCGSCEQCRRGNFIGCNERTEVGVFRRNGAYAHYVVVPARFVHRIPADMPLAKAALCEPIAVVLKGLRRLSGVMGAKSRCAVVGAGPIGHIAAKVLKLRGHEVTAFDRNTARLAVLDGGIGTSSDLRELSSYDVVIEATGNPDALADVLRETPAGCVILLLGLPYAQREFSFEAIAAYDKSVIGSVGSTAEDFDAAIRLLPQLDIDALVETKMPLEQFAQAWAKSSRGETLKIILEVAA